eukprot:284555_1
MSIRNRNSEAGSSDIDGEIIVRISNTGQDIHIPVSNSICVGEVRSKILELTSDSDRDNGEVVQNNEENVGEQRMCRVRLFRSGAELRSDQMTLQECGIHFGVIQCIISRIQPSHHQDGTPVTNSTIVTALLLTAVFCFVPFVTLLYQMANLFTFKSKAFLG